MEVELGSWETANEARSFITIPGSWPIDYFPERKVGQTALSPGPIGKMFELVGWGTGRLALLGPDGVIYKVVHGCACGQECSAYQQNQEEMALFRMSEHIGYSWTPDFFYYGRPLDVMSMRYYNTDTKGLCAHLEIQQPELIQEITEYTLDFDDPNLGLREDGSVVLIDGGRSMVFPATKRKKTRAAYSPGALVS